MPRTPTKLILKCMCLAAAQPLCHFQQWGPKWKTQILSVSVGRKLKSPPFIVPLEETGANRTANTRVAEDRISGICV